MELTEEEKKLVEKYKGYSRFEIAIDLSSISPKDLSAPTFDKYKADNLKYPVALSILIDKQKPYLKIPCPYVSL